LNKSWHYLLFTVSVIFGYYYFWIYGNYPNVGHDLAYGLPAVFEMREAFWKHGVFDVEFSPARCLGLPVFSNPNSLVWSLYHPASILFEGVQGLFAATLAIVFFGFFGTLRLCEFLGLRKKSALLLAAAWCLQGWSMSHTMAGHLSYAQLLLLPFFLWVLVLPKPPWFLLGAAGFWIAHLFFAGGYYLAVILFPSLLLSLALLRKLDPAFKEKSSVGWISFFGRSALIGFVAVIAASPKIIAALDFSSNYPRSVNLIRIKLIPALLYTSMTLGLTIPMEYNRIATWWFGFWESNLFLFPNVLWILAYYWRRKFIALDFKPFLKTFVALYLIGFILPVLSTLHVNPRWYGVILFPFFCWMLSLFLRMENSDTKHYQGLKLFGWISFLVTPLLFNSVNQGVSFYPDHGGIADRIDRISFCYEPIFGYGLERFPYASNQVDWLNGPRVDPRCYLNSAGCTPGTLLTGNPAKAEDLQRLETYSLKEDYALLRWIKPPTLMLYVLGFFMAVWAFFWMLKQEFRLPGHPH
jgi:hypothetical protein